MKVTHKVRNNSKLFATILALVLIITTMLPVSAFAASPESAQLTQEQRDALGTEMLVNTPEEEEALQKRGIAAEPNEITTRAVTASNFVSGYGTSRKYYTADFWQIQFDNNCTPTLAANVLSYFQGSRGVQLNAGNITQSLYDQICVDIGYDISRGSNLDGVAKGLKTWASRYGKTAVIDEYWLNNWSDVTRDIDANKPVMLGYSGHAYLIFGYKVENNIQYLYVFTGWNNVPYQWLPFEGGAFGKMQMQSVNIY